MANLRSKVYFKIQSIVDNQSSQAALGYYFLRSSLIYTPAQFQVSGDVGSKVNDIICLSNGLHNIISMAHNLC
jgi:hypothetical protein